MSTWWRKTDVRIGFSGQKNLLNDHTHQLCISKKMFCNAVNLHSWSLHSLWMIKPGIFQSSGSLNHWGLVLLFLNLYCDLTFILIFSAQDSWWHTRYQQFISDPEFTIMDSLQINLHSWWLLVTSPFVLMYLKDCLFFFYFC